MNAQEIFDQVVGHLRKQKVRAINRQTLACAYRDPEGRKCAVGCLISDDDYALNMEGRTVYELINMFDSMRKYRPYSSLLNELQVVHDKTFPYLWESCLREIATLYQLEYKP